MEFDIRNVKPPNAIEKLEELEFDPINETIKTYSQINAAVDKLMSQQKYSPIALSQLLALKQKTANDLMRYKYSRTVETSIVETDNCIPFTITLTGVQV